MLIEFSISIFVFQKQIENILQTDAQREPATPIAVLTSMTPSQRCQEVQRLKCLSQRNRTNLSVLRDALFVVAIDPDDFPRTANEAMFALHSGNFVNRWYDKSVQLIVFGNGVAGFVNNYLAGMTGTVGTNFVRIAVENERMRDESTAEGKLVMNKFFFFNYENDLEQLMANRQDWYSRIIMLIFYLPFALL